MAEAHPTAATETHSTTETPAPAGDIHAPPSFYGVTAPMFIALAMLVVIGVMIWKKVPAAIARALDHKIAGIREQLAEAEALRKEAEALKGEYEAKAAAAAADAAAMVERARHESDALLAKARQDAEALVERRTRMAEERIAAEERAAVQQLRAAAADAATRAAARLIAERVDAGADSAMVDAAISEIGRR
ncbi:MAG: F0F1 ATP synthase subunit B [Sphingomonas sp.]|nr:F0F1 ATP synthase subunit B [Sphingomonas sp.]